MTEDTDQPSADSAGTLTESAAADLLQNWRDEPEQQAPAVDSARAKANAAEEATESTEVESSPEAESEVEAGEAETEDATDAEQSDDIYVHGNAKTRLRDGTEVSIGELKKSFDEAREFRRLQDEFNAEKRDLAAKMAQNAQQEQLFTSTIQQAIAALEHTLPPEPDPTLRDKDPIAYFLQKDAREAKQHEINRLHHTQQARAEQAQAEQATQFQAHLKSEQTRLYERAPELRDESKRQEFFGKLIASGREYGFSEQEMNNIYDHRVMLMAKDAIAYRNLQAAKPKAVEKGKAAKPVVKPGQRVAPTSTIAAKHKTLFDRAQKTRSIDDVGALLAELE